MKLNELKEKVFKITGTSTNKELKSCLKDENLKKLPLNKKTSWEQIYESLMKTDFTEDDVTENEDDFTEDDVTENEDDLKKQVVQDTNFKDYNIITGLPHQQDPDNPQPYSDALINVFPKEQTEENKENVEKSLEENVEENTDYIDDTDHTGNVEDYVDDNDYTGNVDYVDDNDYTGNVDYVDDNNYIGNVEGNVPEFEGSIYGEIKSYIPEYEINENGEIVITSYKTNYKPLGIIKKDDPPVVELGKVLWEASKLLFTNLKIKFKEGLSILKDNFNKEVQLEKQKRIENE